MLIKLMGLPLSYFVEPDHGAESIEGKAVALFIYADCHTILN